jgi:hypothetical protein
VTRTTHIFGKNLRPRSWWLPCCPAGAVRHARGYLKVWTHSEHSRGIPDFAPPKKLLVPRAGNRGGSACTSGLPAALHAPRPLRWWMRAARMRSHSQTTPRRAAQGTKGGQLVTPAQRVWLSSGGGPAWLHRPQQSMLFVRLAIEKASQHCCPRLTRFVHMLPTL